MTPSPNVGTPGNIQSHKVDLMSTKDMNMKKRRVINASPAQNDGDYVTLGQLNDSEGALTSNLQDYVKGVLASLSLAFRSSWTYILYLVTSIVAPLEDSIDAIRFTKADGSTDVLVLDTLNGRTLAQGGLYSFKGDHNVLPLANFARLQYDPTGFTNLYGDLTVYNPVGNAFLPLAIRATPLTLGVVGGKLAFFTSDATQAAGKQILNTYTPYVTSTFIGLANGLGGTPYASISDLNNLRIGYENLRAAYDDLRTKIQASTLVG